MSGKDKCRNMESAEHGHRVQKGTRIRSCPCKSENLNKIELKGNGLIGLAEEISRQKNIQAAEWLLFTLFTQICSEREQKVEQEDVKIVLLEGKECESVTVVDRNVQLDEEKSLNQIQLVTELLQNGCGS